MSNTTEAGTEYKEAAYYLEKAVKKNKRGPLSISESEKLDRRVLIDLCFKMLGIELNEQQLNLMLTNSVERMANNAINCGNYLASIKGNPNMADDGSVLADDFKQLKPILTTMWNAIAESHRRRYS